MEENKNEDYGKDVIVIEMSDEEGNMYSYVQEMVIPVGEENFALLVGVDEDGDIIEDEDGEEDVIIAKIVLGEDGENEYIEPTDEEYEKVEKAYDEMMKDEE